MATYYILQEDSYLLLQENGDNLLWRNPDPTVVETTVNLIPKTSMLYKAKYVFVVESIDGTFRYSTENWEFDSISREINGSMMVRIKTDQLTTEIHHAITTLMNRVTIRVSTANTASQGIEYFSGYIPNRSLNLQAENNSVEIIAFGYASRLFDLPYRTGTTVTINKTGGIKASDLAKDVLDKVTALDSTFPADYSATSVEDSSDTIKDKFVMQSAGDVLNRAITLAYDATRIWFWTILGDNIFRFKKSSLTADHNFVYGRDVFSFPQFSEDLQQGVNEVLVVYNGGANIKRVVDTANVTAYGLKSLTVNESTVTDATTATEIGNAYLASRLPPILAITVLVANPYPIESINPGDTCRIDGLPADIKSLLTDNLFITKTTYKKFYVELELSVKSPFISNSIEKIRKRLEKESVETMAATDYS
jgi:hypothetical protein